MACLSCISPAIADDLPKVWIFSGLPGDEEHHAFYEENLAKIRRALTDRYAIPPARITILYGPEQAGYDGPCTRENLLAELGKTAAATHEPDTGTIWLIFQGHANPVAGGAMFNLPGPDVTPREIADALADTKPDAPMAILVTTTASAPFMKALAAPGRRIITANSADDPEEETEFPRALAEVLASDNSDLNDDGLLSVTEIFITCHARVRALYESGGFMIREHARLDGDGDGVGTRRPGEKDAAPAALIGLKPGGAASRFE